MKIIKTVKIVYGIITVIAVIILILLAALALLLGISGVDRENPKSVLGFRAFIVLTGSMNPEFDAGSMIIIKETPADMLREGDIITYRPVNSDDILLTHRIVKLENGEYGTAFITRGDANNMDDPGAAPADSILGKVVFSQNGLGQFIINLRKPAGLGIMVGSIFLLLFIVPYILDNISAKFAEKNNPQTEILSEEPNDPDESDESDKFDNSEENDL